MASQTFDRLFAKAYKESAPILHEVAQLFPVYPFSSPVDLFRFARTLHIAGEQLRGFTDNMYTKNRERINFQRKLEHRPPLRPEYQTLLVLWLEKSPW